MGVFGVYVWCMEGGLVVGVYGFGGVGCEVYVLEVLVLLCVVLVFVLTKPSYSVCDVDCSVGYCRKNKAILFGCVSVDDP